MSGAWGPQSNPNRAHHFQPHLDTHKYTEYTHALMKASRVVKDFKRGLLTVLNRAGKKNEHGHTRWRVRCECGTVFEAWNYNLAKVNGGTNTCGKKKCVGIWTRSMRSLGGEDRLKHLDATSKRIRSHMAQNGGKAK